MIREETPTRRPVFLLVLCILSLVWMGSGFMFGSASLAAGPSSEKQMAEATAEFDKSIQDMKDQNMDSWVPMFIKFKRMTIESNRKFYPMQTTSLLIFVIGIFSVIWMLRRKKLGFHLYIIYSLLGLLQYYFFLSPAMIPTPLVVFNLVLSGIFISMYAANLKWLR